MMLYLEMPKGSIKTVRIKKFSKGYKIIVKKKSLAFLYSNKNNQKQKLRKTISFTIVLTRIKYLGINLANEVKDQYMENGKTRINEIEEGTNEQKYLL